MHWKTKARLLSWSDGLLECSEFALFPSFDYWITPATHGQLPVSSLAIMLRGAFKTRLFHPMQKIRFAEALDSIVKLDRRYERDAYVFLPHALDFTANQQKKVRGPSVRPV